MRPGIVAMVLATAAFHAAAQPPPGLPSDLPLDREGIPTRPLDDAELHRLLVALSATTDAAALLLAACHAAGRGYGTPGWRACVSHGRPPRSER